MKKIPAKKMLKKFSNPYIIVAAATIAGGSAYLLLFTDTIVCRNCVLDKGSVKVSKSELNDAVAIKETFYRYSGSEYDAEKLRQEALKQLENQKRIENYANSKNIKVSKSELDDLYKSRTVQQGSEEQLLSKIKAMYGLSKSEYQDVLRQDILSEKVQSSLGVPLSEWLGKQ